MLYERNQHKYVTRERYPLNNSGAPLAERGRGSRGPSRRQPAPRAAAPAALAHANCGDRIALTARRFARAAPYIYQPGACICYPAPPQRRAAALELGGGSRLVARSSAVAAVAPHGVQMDHALPCHGALAMK